jgi:hypothetical protein
MSSNVIAVLVAVAVAVDAASLRDIARDVRSDRVLLVSMS